MIFQFFPFSTAHQLNLDWILEELKTYPHTVNNTLPDENGNINLPQVSGMSSWNGVGADGSGNVDAYETIADMDSPGDGLHFYLFKPSTVNTPPMMVQGLILSVLGPAPGVDGLQFAVSQYDDTIAYRRCYSGTWSSWTPLEIGRANGEVNNGTLTLVSPVPLDTNGTTFNVNGHVGILNVNIRYLNGFSPDNWTKIYNIDPHPLYPVIETLSVRGQTASVRIQVNGDVEVIGSVEPYTNLIRINIPFLY
ncbi:MAG: hypothetical protein IJI14_00085 [Anaerolineaceae bacterium]|nr:hypothetical protein [Anaerolineaceae bacterium]